jgi:hypothetical protein
MSEEAKKLLYISIFAFGLNLIWENYHVRFYTNVAPGLDFLPFLLLPTLVDVAIIIVGYLLVRRYARLLLTLPAASLLVIYGLVVSVLIELTAVRWSLWSYLTSMPIVPIFNIGLSPVLQMMILPLISVYFGLLLSRKFKWSMR